MTNFLPKLVEILLFSAEKTEFPFFELTIFGYCPTGGSTCAAQNGHLRWTQHRCYFILKQSYQCYERFHKRFIKFGKINVWWMPVMDYCKQKTMSIGSCETSLQYGLIYEGSKNSFQHFWKYHPRSDREVTMQNWEFAGNSATVPCIWPSDSYRFIKQTSNCFQKWKQHSSEELVNICTRSVFLTRGNLGHWLKLHRTWCSKYIELCFGFLSEFSVSVAQGSDGHPKLGLMCFDHKNHWRKPPAHYWPMGSRSGRKTGTQTSPGASCLLKKRLHPGVHSISQVKIYFVQ